ncbi:hypothetical protein EVAR_85771_1 [Eumeta japonica]|uniref:CHK kinase-like domain-containing protein n=1 Tax=Eumeta variegata TaxID=151549 RepID=A0A4C2A3T4_EUMVA|nr:hypothetical protein EVAR_85771_1 [Eumeta japonica]
MTDADRILGELLKTVAKDEGIKEPQFVIKAISTGGANYTSTLHPITIKSYGMKDLELFAKVACVGEQIREVIPADKIYATERFVYQKLAKIYENLQVKNNIPENEKLKFPKFYACKDTRLEETIILQNLMAQGYTCYDRFKPVTWEYAAAAVGALAMLHALSYAYAKDDPEDFTKSVAERAFEVTGPEEQVVDMLKMSETNALEMVPEELKGRLKKFLSEKSGFENFKNYYVFARGPVLVHGDYRVSNIMYRRKMNFGRIEVGKRILIFITDNKFCRQRRRVNCKTRYDYDTKKNLDLQTANGKLDSLIPLDYQTLYAGVPLVDLLYFIFSGTDGQFRKYYYKRLILHYYDTFAGFLTKLGLNPETVYPKKHFDEDYRHYLPFGLIISISALPVVLIEPEKAPTMQGDAKVADMAIKPNEMFRKRFLEIVKDYIDWGVV